MEIRVENMLFVHLITDVKRHLFSPGWSTPTFAEQRKINRGKIASLAGLAPFARDSGASEGKRFIDGGRKPVRETAFHAALSATSCNPVLSEFADRLKAAGKPANVVTIAMTRKLLVICNGPLMGHCWGRMSHPTYMLDTAKWIVSHDWV